MKRVVTVSALVLLSVAMTALPGHIYGQYGAYTGGTADTGIVVDKQVSVKRPGAATTTYTDNLSQQDTRYAPGDAISFTLRVRNTSDRAYGTVVIRDFFPDYIEPDGHEFTRNSRTVTIAAGTLQKGEVKTFTIKAKVVKNEQLPADRAVTCIVNKSQVDAAGVSDQDTSQFCVERQVQGATTVPAAGSETAWAALGFALLASGLLLRRKSGIIEA